MSQTTTDQTTPTSRFEPGAAGFTVVLSMAMAGTALTIDTMLPAFADIRTAMDLEPDSTAVAALVSTFLIGQGIGLLPAGLLADRYGRRPVMWAGIAIYILAAAATALAPTLETMLAARLVWGIGTAGPRVAATAMVRDSFEGEQMAKQMSSIMAVFLIVPTIAPTLGAGLLAIGPWQLVFWICAIYATVVLALTTRLPSTIGNAPTRPTGSSQELRANIRTVLTTPGTVGYVVASVGLYTSFVTYLASSELIIDDVFDLADWFPAIFAAISIVMAAMMLINRQIVTHVGLDRLLRITSRALVAATLGFVVVAIATDGKPPFWLFMTAIVIVIGTRNSSAPTSAQPP